MIEVRQLVPSKDKDKLWRKFYVRDKKKIEFWKAMALRSGRHSECITEVKEVHKREHK